MRDNTTDARVHGLSGGAGEGAKGGSVGVALIFVLGAALSIAVFFLRIELGVWVSLADALLLSGAIFLSAAVLLWVWRLGALDSFLYSLLFALGALLPLFGSRRGATKSAHRKHRAQSVGVRALLAVGIITLLPAVIISFALW